MSSFDSLPRVGDYVEFFDTSSMSSRVVGIWRRGLVVSSRVIHSYQAGSTRGIPVWSILTDDGSVHDHKGISESSGFEIKVMQCRPDLE